jgi:hypothetical protein
MASHFCGITLALSCTNSAGSVQSMRYEAIVGHFRCIRAYQNKNHSLILDYTIVGFLLRLCCHFHCLVTPCFTLFYLCRRGTSWIQQAISLLVRYRPSQGPCYWRCYWLATCGCFPLDHPVSWQEFLLLRVDIHVSLQHQQLVCW